MPPRCILRLDARCHRAGEQRLGESEISSRWHCPDSELLITVTSFRTTATPRTTAIRAAVLLLPIPPHTVPSSTLTAEVGTLWNARRHTSKSGSGLATLRPSLLLSRTALLRPTPAVSARHSPILLIPAAISRLISARTTSSSI